MAKLSARCGSRPSALLLNLQITTCTHHPLPKLYSNLAVSTPFLTESLTPTRASRRAVCPDFGQNTTHPGSDMCANDDDDVVYLYTIRHPEDLPASAIDSNQTVPRTPSHHQSRARQARQASRTQSRRNTRGSRRRTKISSGNAKLRWIIPHAVRNKCVRLGWTPKGAGGEHQSVFGCLDLAGHFHRRIGIEFPSSKSIKHTDIEYRERYSGLSSTEVRNKVLQLLLARYGPALGAGEI